MSRFGVQQDAAKENVCIPEMRRSNSDAALRSRCPVPKDRLVLAGLKAEAAVSGYHADNIAPALLGGFTIVRCSPPETRIMMRQVVQSAAPSRADAAGLGALSCVLGPVPYPENLLLYLEGAAMPAAPTVRCFDRSVDVASGLAQVRISKPCLSKEFILRPWPCIPICREGILRVRVHSYRHPSRTFLRFFETVSIPMFINIGVWGSRESKIIAAYQNFLCRRRSTEPLDLQQLEAGGPLWFVLVIGFSDLAWTQVTQLATFSTCFS